MTAFVLKTYQTAALTALSEFLRAAQAVGAETAFRQQTGRPYQSDMFGPVPCVCLRIPTGGGKTLLASHAIAAMAREWRATDAPVAVWLVPSDAIRTQTLTALRTPGHPYRAALEAAWGQRLQVCDLDDAAVLAPTDWGRQAIVVVATIQGFRVDQTDVRNVYAFSETWERHFRALSAERLAALADIPDARVTAGDAAAPGSPLAAYVGQPKQSLANWLALQNPLVVVDEAHNTRTDLSFRTLARLNPSAILELTATPLPHRTNVLYHVSAQELQAENMVKLPIALREHPDGWQSAVLGAVQVREWLEGEARHDEADGRGYVRPIVLFQAQSASDEVPPAALRQHLIDELHVPAEQIAIATGDTRGLEGVDLLAPDCPIRFVITVQALREGWDCPFAYVLCSLQRLSSATAVEQLLGRVLRMPYATRRGREPLNRAYAHACETTFGAAATALMDRLVGGMGFEALDVASMIAPQSSLFPGDGAAGPPPEPPPVVTVIDLPTGRGLEHAPGVSVAPRSSGSGVSVTLTGHVDAAVEGMLLGNERSDKKRAVLSERISQHNAVVAAQTAPANRGATFGPVPPLGYRTDPAQALLPLEREAVLEAAALDLLAQPVSLPGFQVVESDNAFEIYLDTAQRLRFRQADPGQLSLDAIATSVTVDDLVRWLDREVQQPDIPQPQLRTYLHRVVGHLRDEQHVPLATLARMRFVLAQRITARIADLRQQVAQQRFGQLVLDGGWDVAPDWSRSFRFEAGRYPASAERRYAGRWEFRKHFHPVIADLKSTGEEFECARCIERHPDVRHWIRNPDQADLGWSLPTSRGRFYPDFIVELIDGTIVVVEYKGAHLRNVPTEIEKRHVGELWAAGSAGRCRFGFIYLEDAGRTMAQQVEDLLAVSPAAAR